ncbi:hypothetical protein NDN08_008303 [Rhodosorus marinus]|uniref:1-(5-phosphoribosyl)-5-[(5-phosphoribosylamino)methylideneamino]imidazole-4-carboxamideisomerase n=1 Tax=Rhodosorus marinus TaxID=101924 RepID=A0AAV8V069_9RHOD|nr:hypothetical protein NDN08_008303 [Rhodosorus marinus]
MATGFQSLARVGTTRRASQRNRVEIRAEMRFRPCIDLHAGKVKQIVGSTLKDSDGSASTNFESDLPSSFFATMYKEDNLPGGHVIMLGPGNEEAAKEALGAFPGGLQVGGGINPQNAKDYLDCGASHVIVTSYVFRDGKVDMDRLQELVSAISKDRLVLDVSCRKRDGEYYVCTDRWQKWTDFKLKRESFEFLSGFCDEILVHAVDVEGKRSGIEEELVTLLASTCDIPITYAGGARSLDDLERTRILGNGRVDLTIGSALDIFGGDLSYRDAVKWQRDQEK